MKYSSAVIRFLYSLPILFTGACTSTPSFPPSDHFKDGKFHNRGEEIEPGFFELVKFILGSGEKWPSRVDTPVFKPNLDNPQDDKIKVTFINHATFLIQTHDLNILSDPVFSERVSPFSFAGPKRVRPPGIELKDLPKIDVVIVSHNHYDHMDSKSLQQIALNNPSAIFLIPLGDARHFKNWEISHFVELDWGQSFTKNETVFYFDESQHWSSRTPFDRKKSLWGSFIIKTGHRQIYFAGDTGYGPHFQRINGKYGDMDLSLLPIGAYEPRSFMKYHHMNPSDAVQSHKDLKSKASIAMHFGTFKLTYEARNSPPEDLSTALKEAQVAPEKFKVLQEGDAQLF